MSYYTSLSRLGWLLIALLWTTSAGAQLVKQPLSGDLRLQRGNGVQVPMTSAAPPHGGVVEVWGATVMQTAGPDPRRMTIHPSQLTAPAEMALLPRFASAPPLLELETRIGVQFPKSTAVFQAGGRTGPPTVTWCPGQPLPTASYNPACTDPLATGLWSGGLLRYRKTANQFGGVAQAAFQGIVTSAHLISGSPPCDFATGPCRAGVGNYPPHLAGAWGGAFGFYTTRPGGSGYPAFDARITEAGLVTYVTPTGLWPHWGNPMSSSGAPWTTGQIMVSAKSTIGGGTERFTLTGSDARLSGVGNISLVSGSVSVSGISGPNANRGWLNLTVPEPAAAASAAAALVLLALCHGLVRRRLGCSHPYVRGGCREAEAVPAAGVALRGAAARSTRD